MSLEIRTYTKDDKEKLLNIISLNVPEYFAESEIEDYNLYLEHEVEDYFVVVEEGEMVGAGGINYKLHEGTAYISWDVIHPAYQNKGIGRNLLNYRISLISDNRNINKTIVRTSQLVYRFYEKNGFVLKEIHHDYWAKGYDMYYMIYEPLPNG